MYLSLTSCCTWSALCLLAALCSIIQKKIEAPDHQSYDRVEMQHSRSQWKHTRWLELKTYWLSCRSKVEMLCTCVRWNLGVRRHQKEMDRMLHEAEVPSWNRTRDVVIMSLKPQDKLFIFSRFLTKTLAGAESELKWTFLPSFSTVKLLPTQLSMSKSHWMCIVIVSAFGI